MTKCKYCGQRGLLWRQVEVHPNEPYAWRLWDPRISGLHDCEKYVPPIVRKPPRKPPPAYPELPVTNKRRVISRRSVNNYES